MKIQNQNRINFCSGLTAQFRREIKSCDIQKIERGFWENNIPANFKDNKTVAWCALQALNISKKTGLGLPKEVYVEDFSKLIPEKQGHFAICNALPSFFCGVGKVIPTNSVYYNSLIDWSKIDEISDELGEEGYLSTDYFLEIILHEFTHAMHNTNLFKNLSVNKAVRQYRSLADSSKLKNFTKKYASHLSGICKYAEKSPYEAVACDLSKRIIQNTDKETLCVNTQFLAKSPYREVSSHDRGIDTDKTSRLLRNFWLGKFRI